MTENNKEEEPKIKKKENKILKVILYSVVLIIVAILVISFNASITFLIKDATPTILDEILPSDCFGPPFGSESVSACSNNSFTDIVKDVCNAVGYVKNTPKIAKIDNHDNDKRSIPYKWFTNNPSNIFREYLNWVLNSLIQTEIKVDGYTKDFLTWIKDKPISMESVLLVFSFILANFMIIPWVGIYAFFSLLYHQVIGGASYGIFTMILIFLTAIPVFLADIGISFYQMIKLLYNLSVTPLFNREWRRLIKIIVNKNKILVGYIFGFIFLQILYSIDMNKFYSKPVKLVPTIIFYLIIVTHFIQWFIKNKV